MKERPEGEIHNAVPPPRCTEPKGHKGPCCCSVRVYTTRACQQETNCPRCLIDYATDLAYQEIINADAS